MWNCGDILRLFETNANKYMVLWRYTPVIWNKVKQICGIAEIHSGYLKQRKTNTWSFWDILQLFGTKKTNMWNCGNILRLFVKKKKKLTNMWYCGDILRLLGTKFNKFVVLWRETPVIWNKGKQICGVVEIYSGYLKTSKFVELMSPAS